MSVFSENADIKIKETVCLSWGASKVKVAPRPYHALAYRIKGEAEFLFENGGEQTQTKEGDVFFMPAGREYQASYAKENKIIAVHFFSKICGNAENYVFENSGEGKIEEKFLKIYKLWSEKPEGYYYRSLSVLCEIIEGIINSENKERKDETQKAFERSVEYIDNNFSDSDFSVEKAINSSHMSGTWFRRLFFEKYGETPAKYITHKRLAKAEALLASGGIGVCEVAELCGFSEAKYFSRCVKKHYGCPPSKLYKHIKTK